MTDRIIIFTDGGALGNPGPGGWGAIVSTPDGRVRELGGGAAHTTNNRMELTGPIEALKSITGISGPGRLCTDSQYVIRGITQWIHGWRRNGWKTASGGEVLNREYWEKLLALVAGRGSSGRIEWHYVPGHRGVPGNERVDEIAGAFSSGNRIELYDGPLIGYPIDLQTFAPEAAEPKSSTSRLSASRSKSAKGKPYSYLSVVDGMPMRHTTWSACETRVRGMSNARFKKAMTAEEEVEILQTWGFKPSDV